MASIHHLYAWKTDRQEKDMSKKCHYFLSNTGDKALSGTGGESYLIVVAFGEEQGTELTVQRRLVGLVAVFG